MAEDKERFVNAVVEALIACGDGRYDWLMEQQVHYGERNGIQFIETPSHIRYDITCDSLTSIMGVIKRIVE